MTIIQIDPLETGQHPIQSQSGRRACWLDGYIEVPAHLHDAVWATYGWCDLQIEGDKLVEAVLNGRHLKGGPMGGDLSYSK